MSNILGYVMRWRSGKMNGTAVEGTGMRALIGTHVQNWSDVGAFMSLNLKMHGCTLRRWRFMSGESEMTYLRVAL